jgi:hypothetical protein
VFVAIGGVTGVVAGVVAGVGTGVTAVVAIPSSAAMLGISDVCSEDSIGGGVGTVVRTSGGVGAATG